MDWSEIINCILFGILIGGGIFVARLVIKDVILWWRER